MMHRMDAQTRIAQTRKLVQDNRHLWREMDRDRIVSYSYLQRFAAGDYENPGLVTLEKIERYLQEAAA